METNTIIAIAVVILMVVIMMADKKKNTIPDTESHTIIVKHGLDTDLLATLNQMSSMMSPPNYT